MHRQRIMPQRAAGGALLPWFWIPRCDFDIRKRKLEKLLLTRPPPPRNHQKIFFQIFPALKSIDYEGRLVEKRSSQNEVVSSKKPSKVFSLMAHSVEAEPKISSFRVTPKKKTRCFFRAVRLGLRKFLIKTPPSGTWTANLPPEKLVVGRRDKPVLLGRRVSFGEQVLWPKSGAKFCDSFNLPGLSKVRNMPLAQWKKKTWVVFKGFFGRSLMSHYI